MFINKVLLLLLLLIIAELSGRHRQSPIRDLKIRRRRMSATAVMTEGDWEEVAVGAGNFVYIFSIFIVKYFSHSFL